MDAARKLAVVLAGSQGIGFASALRLARAGHRVVIFSRSRAKLDAALTRLRGVSEDVSAVAGDVSSDRDLEALFAHADALGGTEILINNNGGPATGNLLTLGDDDWQAAFAQHALPVFRAIRRVVPRMIERSWGRVITIASISVKMPLDDLDLSNFMRAGLAAVHRTLARALAKHGVNVHMVLPGSIMTDRSRLLIEGRASRQGISFEQALSASTARIPKGRLGAPEDVAEAVAFLASTQADYLTGNFMQVDGGLFPGLD
jgi:3-oxoacyl-[acyl-carrier protein] reductase